MENPPDLNGMIKYLKEDAAMRDENNKETIKLLREEGARKDLMIEKLVKEISDLRNQLSEFTKKIELYAGNNASSAKGSSMEEETVSSDKSQTGEEPNKPVEDDFERPKNRKEKRKKRFNQSSDEEESTPKRQPLSTERQDTTGKSSLNSTDFPPLPPSKATNPIDKQTNPTPCSNQVPSTPPSKIAKRPVRAKEIPPIIIQNAGKFNEISGHLRNEKIRYSSAVVVRNGIKIFPVTETDYRKTTAFLDKNKEPYYTFRFPEEKLNHVVLRGAPIHLTKEQISEDLSRQGFNPKNIIRWFYPNGKPMPMVLVLLPKAEKDIFMVRVVCTFEVRVESQKSKSRSIQCYNCQDHGHAAPCCHIPPKCVKCGESHHTSVCKKTKEEPPKCANCAGDHPASFSGCPRHPSQLRPKNSPLSKAGGHKIIFVLPPKKSTTPTGPLPNL